MNDTLQTGENIHWDLVGGVKSVVLGTDEFNSQQKQHASARFGFLSQWSCHWEQKIFLFLILKLFKTWKLLFLSRQKNAAANFEKK